MTPIQPALEKILTPSVNRPAPLEPGEAARCARGESQAKACATILPDPTCTESGNSRVRALRRPGEEALNVFVIFTSVEATLQALKEAGNLAHQLNGRIMLVAPQVVPYALPLTSPPVLRDSNERRLRVMADHSAVETIVRIYLCRDPGQAMERVLRPHSLVVIGGRKRWWPTRESRLAARLRRAGHEVILTATE